MKSKYILQFFLFLVLFSGCDSEDNVAQQPFVIAFERQSYDFSTIADNKEMKLVFSEKAQTAGSVTIRITSENAQYGVDFSTFPDATDQTIEIGFEKGQQDAAFTFTNLIFPFDSDDKSVLFELIAINYNSETAIQGYKTALISFQRSLGAVMAPEIGGPNQGDQVYIDLSTEAITKRRRDSWDLGFYAGDQFRVVLNGSLYMAAKALEETNIDAVTSASVSAFQNQVAVGTFDPTNINYIDAPLGDITQTAIAEVSTVDSDNKVYLVNLGYQIGTDAPLPGSVAIAGNPRGWKKIRILRNESGYLLQYADLSSTTHQEIAISKDEAYNFSFFSFNTNNVVPVEPEKTKWDLNFTVFTNEIVGSGSYGYSDFVVNNLKAGVKVYEVNTSSFAYSAFSLANVSEASFLNDQRVIGADWRNVFTGSAFTDRFFVLKDVDGNYYKIRMLAFLNDGGVRGYPKFEYQLLQ